MKCGGAKGNKLFTLKFYPAPDAVWNKAPEESHDAIAEVDHPDVATVINAANDVACYGFWFQHHGIFERA